MSLDPAAPRTDFLDLGPVHHLLPDACLVSCESGELRVASTDGECARLGEGDLLRMQVGSSCKARAVGPRARASVLRTGVDWLRSALALVGDDAAALATPIFCIERAASDGARRARRLFGALAAATDAEDRSRRMRHGALRLELLALALEAPPAEPPQGGPRRANPYRAELVRLVSALREASLEEVSLASLSEQIGLSERQVSRLFREEFGTTFRDHLATLRLERAKRLLAATDLPVIEVAGSTGWSSLAHFNAVFRRRVGLTPSAFRSGEFAFPTP
jgi:AraC-like DNA-binding protein